MTEYPVAGDPASDTGDPVWKAVAAADPAGILTTFTLDGGPHSPEVPREGDGASIGCGSGKFKPH